MQLRGKEVNYLYQKLYCFYETKLHVNEEEKLISETEEVSTLLVASRVVRETRGDFSRRGIVHGNDE